MSRGQGWPIAPASKRNMMLLIQLRWLAVLGQLATIWFTAAVLHVHLPVFQMMVVLVALALVNLVTLVLSIGRRGFSYIELLGVLMLDVSALAWQLYQTGGGTNPFVFLFLLQIVIGAILLPPRWSWIIALLAACDATFLTFWFEPLTLPSAYDGVHFQLYLIGSLICFLLIASLLVIFVVRIDRNRRASDAALAALRQQAAEEDHIVRLGLLASGAAHELGTPLASMSVILGDWMHHPTFATDAELSEDVALMQAELKRCKAILSGILISGGEIRGENPQVTSVRGFLTEVVEDWRARSICPISFTDEFGEDVDIVSDPALRQVVGNIIDNAIEASPQGITISARRETGALVLTVIDQGPGFDEDILSQIGKPYASNKGRPGGGLGLFLVVNVARKLGGRLNITNLPEGGAQVDLRIPLSALAFQGKAKG
ncbi:MAG: HAMP domain-containing histidine kinase [Sphingomonadales bacterium]|nr:HAMP domain-containing histidine kinase [Sphingomonadales bacterium]MDE2168496.1 HAMP domain-containing histidine kinase [Sphingomonadales bacterium]